jgi:hypothetical protein
MNDLKCAQRTPARRSQIISIKWLAWEKWRIKNGLHPYSGATRKHIILSFNRNLRTHYGSNILVVCTVWGYRSVFRNWLTSTKFGTQVSFAQSRVLTLNPEKSIPITPDWAFELRASCLQSRHSIAWATPPFHFALVI